MRTRYEFVDVDGAPINTAQFTLKKNIPIRLKHVRFEQDKEAVGYEQILVLVYEYLHTETGTSEHEPETEMWNIAARVGAGTIDRLLDVLRAYDVEIYRAWKVEYRPR